MEDFGTLWSKKSTAILVPDWHRWLTTTVCKRRKWNCCRNSQVCYFNGIRGGIGRVTSDLPGSEWQRGSCRCLDTSTSLPPANEALHRFFGGKRSSEKIRDLHSFSRLTEYHFKFFGRFWSHSWSVPIFVTWMFCWSPGDSMIFGQRAATRGVRARSLRSGCIEFMIWFVFWSYPMISFVFQNLMDFSNLFLAVGCSFQWVFRFRAFQLRKGLHLDVLGHVAWFPAVHRRSGMWFLRWKKGSDGKRSDFSDFFKSFYRIRCSEDEFDIVEVLRRVKNKKPN